VKITRWIVLLVVVLPVVAFSSESISWTFYAPGATVSGPFNMQGSGVPAYPDAEGQNNSESLHTLDDVRMGKSRYVTLASARVMKGRWYCIGAVVYTSPIDRQTHTLTNVVGYVHDTGCAFNGSCSSNFLNQFSRGVVRTDKMDIALGRFYGWGAGVAAQFVIKNLNRAPSSWQLITGLPVAGSSNNPSACNGTPSEAGVPYVAQYSPTSITDPYSTYGNFGAFGNGGMFSGAQGMTGTFQPINGSQSNGILYGKDYNYGEGNGASPNDQDKNLAPPGESAMNLLLWPKTVLRGESINVIWTSVNMAKDSCQVLFDGQVFATGSEGSKQFKTVTWDKSAPSFVLRCKDSAGNVREVSDTAQITQ
jgi:hypothetical protein